MHPATGRHTNGPEMKAQPATNLYFPRTTASSLLLLICALTFFGCAHGFGQSPDSVADFIYENCIRQRPPEIDVGDKIDTGFTDKLYVQWEHKDAFKSITPSRRYESCYSVKFMVKGQRDNPQRFYNLDPRELADKLKRRLNPHYVGKSSSETDTRIGLLLDDAGSNIYIKEYRPPNGLLEFDQPRTWIVFDYYGDPTMSPAEFRQMRQATPGHKEYLKYAIAQEENRWHRNREAARKIDDWHRKNRERSKRAWINAAGRAVENARLKQERENIYLTEQPLPMGSPSYHSSKKRSSRTDSTATADRPAATDSRKTAECSDRCQEIASTNDGYCCMKGCTGCPCMEGCHVVGGY